MKPLIYALYLPQYYETKYNNEWWGKGYTEWTACKAARPLFKGHYQPRIPMNENYYDLSTSDAIAWQMKLARQYGVDGFAIYHYYSVGSKLLNIPTEVIRDNNDLDLPFFLYWANESWRKNWFGQDSKIIWEQKYGSEKEWRDHFEYCLRFFKKENYLKIDNRPVFAIYKPSDFKDVELFIDYWNTLAISAGFKGMYFIKTIGTRDKQDLDKFSCTLTREPNYTFGHRETVLTKAYRVVRTRLIGAINKHLLIPIGKGIPVYRIPYERVWDRIIDAPAQRGTTALGAFVDWDASPRRGYNATIVTGATPEKFVHYIKKLYAKACAIESPLIVINAWNEWGEGAYLEPDERYGDGYLRAVSSLRGQDKGLNE